MFSQDDDNQGVVLGVVFGLIALVIALVIGVAISSTEEPVAAAPAAASTVVPATAETPATPVIVPVDADAASVKVENGVVKFYFASGNADLAAGANEALADVARAVAAGKTAAISGFHDATGNAAKNAELAKQRALAVRDALTALGVPKDKIELKKPEATTASGSNAQARRVEVAVQ